jgi:proteasome alpha subunit
MPFFYSPEGRLLQVDYALQAVNRGSTTVGLKTKDFAVLSSHVKPTRNLLEPAEKVFVVDEHVGATGSGYIGDVTSLVDEIRVQAQRHRLVYDVPIDVGSLARHLGQYLHNFTLYTVRPFGASLILAGIDPLGVQLLQIDPSGTTFRGNGFAIGAGADEALDVLAKGYRGDLRADEAIALTTRAIESLNGGGTAIEHGVITRESGKFVHMNGGKAPKPPARPTS